LNAFDTNAALVPVRFSPSCIEWNIRVSKGGKWVNREELYRQFVKAVNRTLGRQAVTVDEVKALVREGKRIRRENGVMGLWSYATRLPERFFSRQEFERLRRSPGWQEWTDRILKLLVAEELITPTEARFIKRSL
jgi:hypothetical protein